MVLHSGFPEIPPPLFMNGYSKPSGSLLHHWVLEKDTSVLRSLCFFGTPFGLSQSNLSYAACPEDPELLATSRDPSLVLNSLWSSKLGRLGLFFLPFVSWALRPILSWILGSESFGLTILFPCGGLNPFIITFHGVGPSCYFFGPWCYDFLDLNTRLLLIMFISYLLYVCVF